MSRYVLSLGSNCIDKIANIQAAFEWVKSMSTSFRASEIYETKALNGKDEDYANAVCICSIDICFEDFNKILKLYEKDNGRTPESKITGVIPIDLDIVMTDDEVVRQKDFIQDYFQIGWKSIK